jgi:hypothetical protein
MLVKIKIYLAAAASFALLLLYAISRNRKVKEQAEQLKIQKKVIEVNAAVSKARQKAEKQARETTKDAINKARGGDRSHFSNDGMRNSKD